jgi:hypothetical protein
VNNDPKAIASDIARELRANPATWTQGVMARNAAGAQALVDESGACSWCLVGHIERRLKDRLINRPDVIDAFRRHLERDRKSIVAFNDVRSRTVDDVIALCEKVAAS